MNTLGPIRAGVGLLELSAPWLGAPVLGESMGSGARMAAGVLGARQFVQALVSGAQPSRSVLALGAELDTLHAASMVAVSVLDRRLRRAAGVDALVATLLAVVGMCAARRTTGWSTPSRSGGLGRRRDRWATAAARKLVPARLLEV
jgi:hypothetical protein